MKYGAMLLIGLAAGCASWSVPGPGPTRDGIAVRAASRDVAVARRAALERLLGLFIPEDVRRKSSGVVDKALASPEAFIGQESFPKRGDAIVEVRIDALSMALRKAGVVIPPEFDAGPDNVLIAFGDRAVGSNGAERLAADAFETALFGRGVEALNADDDLRRPERPLTAKSETETVAQAAARGVSWLALGRAAVAAGPEPAASAWRAKARLNLSIYELRSSTSSVSWEGVADAVDVSSQPAAARAIEQVVQDGAARLDGWIKRRRARRATLGIFVSGRKDPDAILKLVKLIRRTPGIRGASLAMWRSLDDMALIHAYAEEIKVDELAARLLRQDPALQVESVETQDNRMTLGVASAVPADDLGM